MVLAVAFNVRSLTGLGSANIEEERHPCLEELPSFMHLPPEEFEWL